MLPWIALAGLALPSLAHGEPCGDGVVDDDEACDLGLGNEASRACTPACTDAVCGDGVRSLDEACDDGNVIDGDGCDGSCRDERAPAWSAVLDGRALQDESFVALERFADTTVVLHHTADEWQEWASSLVAYGPDGQRWSRAHGSPEAGRFDALALGDAMVIAVGRRGVVPQWQGAIATYSHAGQAIGESLLPQTEHLSAVAVAPNGDLFLGGTTVNEDSDRWFGRYALDTDTLVWSRDFPRTGSTEVVGALVLRDRVGLFATGIAGNEPFLLRLDPATGELAWDIRRLPEGSMFRADAFDLVVTEDRVVLAGRAYREINRLYGWDTDGWIASFTHDGEFDWERFDAAPLPTTDGFFALAETEDGGLVAAGYRHRQALATFVDWDIDGVLVEYDAQGNRGRELVYDGSVHLSDSFRDVNSLGDGRFLVAGQTAGSMEAEVGLLAEFTLPALAPSEVRRPSTPSAVSTPRTAHAAAPHTQTLYVNFGGGSLRPGDDGRLNALPCIDSAFDYPGSEAGHLFVGTVMERVQLLLEPFDVEVVWENRPPDALPYTTVVVGGQAEQIGVDPAAAGFACDIDCGNARDNELVFAFEDGTPETLANTIVHEAAHAWGLDHVIDTSAVMSPFASGTEATLVDRCIDISEETSTPTCLEAHAEFCPRGQQDANAELRARFGERRPDIDPPVIAGLPEAGIDVAPGEPITFALSVEDDSSNPGVELRVDALGIRETLDPDALDFDIHLPEGEHLVELVALDHAGNTAAESIVVRVAPMEAGSSSGSGGEDTDEPDLPPADTDPLEPDADDDTAGAQGCGCRSGSPRSPLDLLALTLIGFVTRRGCRGSRSTPPRTRRRSARRRSRAS